MARGKVQRSAGPRGRKRGGSPGRGGSKWGNAEWRKQELARRRELYPKWSNEQINEFVESFSMSPEEACEVPKLANEESLVAFTQAARKAGFFCERYFATEDSSHVRVMLSKVALPEGLPLPEHGIHGAWYTNHLVIPRLHRLLAEQEALSGRLNGEASGGRQGPRRFAVPDITSTSIDVEAAHRMRCEHNARLQKPEVARMTEARCKLPAFTKRPDVLDAVHNSQVTIISGATGCGKTTQIPQYIIEDAVQRLSGPSTSVVCTQPRRLAVVAAARRVAAERGEAVGSTIGYQIRFEKAATNGVTRLLFCTPGILLRRLALDPDLSALSHIVIDEIHERGTETDLLLAVVRDLLPRRPGLKVVLMSATLDAAALGTYFEGARELHIPGRTFPVDVLHLEDALVHSRLCVRPPEEAGTQKDARRAYKSVQNNSAQSPQNKLMEGVDIHVVAGRLPAPAAYSLRNWWARTLSSRLDGASINCLDFVADFLCWLHANEVGGGSFLVFCCGFMHIKCLKQLLDQHAGDGKLHGGQILPLYGDMGTSSQLEVFNPARRGCRKIILATNIAETSLTIDDVTIVVDLGYHKVTAYNHSAHINELQPAWVSKANAKQRSGRAGRVQAGMCYRLYPEAMYDCLDAQLVPEMLRVRLESVCLQIKDMGLGLVGPVLANVLSPPSKQAIENALMYLGQIGALAEGEMLTPLGRHLASLPVDPGVGKLLVLGATFDCLSAVLTLAVCEASDRSPFAQPMDRLDLARERHSRFCPGGRSDHFALMAAFEQFRYLEASSSRASVQDWCYQNFLKWDVLNRMQANRIKLARELLSSGFLPRAAMCVDTGFSDKEVEDAIECHSGHSAAEGLVQALLVAGYYPNVAAVRPARRGRTPSGMPNGIKCQDRQSGNVNIHPSSLLQFSGDEPRDWQWIVYSEKIKLSSQVYVSRATLVPGSAILLFAGEANVRLGPHGSEHASVGIHGDFLNFKTNRDTIELATQLRTRLNDLLQLKFRSPGLDLTRLAGPLVEAVLCFLQQGNTAPGTV